MPQRRACFLAVGQLSSSRPGRLAMCFPGNMTEIKGKPLQTNGVWVVFNRITLSKKRKVWYQCASMQS